MGSGADAVRFSVFFSGSGGGWFAPQGGLGEAGGESAGLPPLGDIRRLSGEPEGEKKDGMKAGRGVAYSTPF